MVSPQRSQLFFRRGCLFQQLTNLATCLRGELAFGGSFLQDASRRADIKVVFVLLQMYQLRVEEFVEIEHLCERLSFAIAHFENPAIAAVDNLVVMTLTGIAPIADVHGSVG